VYAFVHACPSLASAPTPSRAPLRFAPSFNGHWLFSLFLSLVKTCFPLTDALRSVVLDSWTWDQLRVMKVGGNLRALEHFKKYGVGAATSDIKAKYTGKAALLYKDKLQSLASEDAKRNPGVVLTDGADGHQDEAAAPKAAEEDDFFSNWDAPKKSSEAQAAATPPPARRTAVAAPQPAAKSALGAMTRRPGSGTSSGTAGGASKGKLGVKKASTPFNFEEAERRAKEEEELAKRLGMATAATAAPEAAANAAGSSALSASSPDTPAFSSRLTYHESSAGAITSTDVDRAGASLGRLGFGATSSHAAKPAASAAATGRLGFGAVQAASSASSNRVSLRSTVATTRRRQPVDPPSGPPTAAAPLLLALESLADASGKDYSQYSKQKAISSDQFFGRGEWDQQAQAADRANLSRFEGATSLSSDQYFGRDDHGAAAGSADRRTSVSEYQAHAADFARKFVGQAASDLSAVRNVVSQGTAKVRGPRPDSVSVPFRSF
ncbi:MAG: hypothetical protein BJ554DRAFT_8338, partial [Olpidium bornovanus]